MDLENYLKIAKAALMLSSCFTWEDTGRNLRIDMGNHPNDVHSAITKLGSGIFLGERSLTAHITSGA